MTISPAIEVPDEAIWDTLPKGACVFLVHPDGRILGRQDKALDLPLWDVPGQPRLKGDSARENAVRALAVQARIGVRTAVLHPLYSAPRHDGTQWRFVDAFWTLWNPSLGHPVSGQADHAVAWVAIETLLSQREVTQFEAEAIGHLATALHGAHLAV